MPAAQSAYVVHEPEQYAPPSGRWQLRGRKAYDDLYIRSQTDPDAFWAREAKSGFHWNKSWDTVCKYNWDCNEGPIYMTWFEGAETNVCYNALDRHVEAGHGNRVALLFEGNDIGCQQKLTYKELLELVCRIANYLKSIGVQRGDDVTIYMPMIPELPATMLACSRIGAVHSVVFAGFSSESLAERIADSRPRVVITATGSKRGPKLSILKDLMDQALEMSMAMGHEVEHCLVYNHSLAVDSQQVSFRPGRDVWWHEVVDVQPSSAPVEWVPAEAPLFKLYTSGSTGKPKAVLHTTAGYMVGTATSYKYVFDASVDDVYWCTADCGWITGHSYVTYGPLLNMATQVIYEGLPTWPDAGRNWDIVDKYKVSVFYTAPTAIRGLQAKGDMHVMRHSRASLRLLGTVGEPIHPETWHWYYHVVGSGRCPILDTYWQTETGTHMITPLGGAIALKPGSCGLPFFGVEAVVLDGAGRELQGECEGYLMFKRPWPGIMRTLAGDHAKFEQTYFSLRPGLYFTGDGCRRDADGYIWIIGRVDDVINVSGHRIGSAEVESALIAHEACVEAAVVPLEHEIKGQGIYAFVTLREGCQYPAPQLLKDSLRESVRKAIGTLATPDVIHWAPALPKTRSGKIMRRILRKIANNEEDELGDISTLSDPTVVQTLLDLRGR